MDILIVGLLIIAIILLVVVIVRRPEDRDSRAVQERLVRLESEIEKLTPRIESEFRENRREIADNFGQIQKTVDTRVKSLQEDNSARLEQMRQTVDEKLQESVEKRFNESFRRISSQLTQVYQGLGEMRTLANGVGDLKKVMEGVKTRGIYGEVQLGNIISDCMMHDQYVENFITKKGSMDRVEFAIKMPGRHEEMIYLPIDSKFPVENYSRLVAAYDSGNKVDIEQFRKELAKDVKTQAKKIADKYLDPPATTDFGIMFVPTESLYAEILRIPGLFDEVRQKMRVTICSPSADYFVWSYYGVPYRSNRKTQC